jgi:hypothetical protein
MYKPLTSTKGLDKAQRRLTGFRYLNPNLDFGNGVSVPDFALKTEAMQAKLEAHNALVAEFTAKIMASREEISQLDKALSDTAERMLNTIAAIYGRTSDEYEMVGGTKRDTSKKKAEKTAKSAPAKTNSSNDRVLDLEPMKISKNTAKTNGNGKVAIA